MELFLVRHGETEWSSLGRHTGRTDIPLTPAGREQAGRLRPLIDRYLGERKFERVVTSPAQRAVQTAEALFGAYVIEPDDRLFEYDYGVYEGLTRKEILERDPGWSVWETGCPGGETIADVSRRADDFLASMAGHEPVALIAHGHFCRVVAARALGLPGSAGRLFATSTASLSIVRTYHGERCAYLWNATVAPSDDATTRKGN